MATTRPHRTSLRKVAVLLAVALAAGSAATAVVATANAATVGCRVSYSVTSQWNNGFGAAITVTNLGDQLNGWSLVWSFTAGQQVTQGWSATFSQNGAQVTATNASWATTLGTGASATIGFNASWNGVANTNPTSFALNGTVCTGTVVGTTTPASTTPPPTSAPATSQPPITTTPPPTGSLPTSFGWSSSNALISPKSDATHNIAGIKDPSVVFANGRWHVFASVANASGYNLVYLNFTDWSQAGAAAQFYLDRTPIGSGYRAAPQVFYFAPQNLWYLVYQTGNASYSTNPDISNPNGWSAPRNFYSSMPTIISQNIGSGFWVDMWVICDSANCYLYSSDDNGHLYRSQTTLANFPNGFTNTRIELQDANRNNLFEASNVYRVGTSNTYLLLIEAIGSNGRRYFRSWTANGLNGTWQSLAATETNPFARAGNTTFSGTAWTQDISHGEMIRSGVDQNLAISPCNMRYLYQGLSPTAGGDYNSLPWRLGMLTQTNSTC
jgi:hypothetical protein